MKMRIFCLASALLLLMACGSNVNNDSNNKDEMSYETEQNNESDNTNTEYTCEIEDRDEYINRIISGNEEKLSNYTTSNASNDIAKGSIQKYISTLENNLYDFSNEDLEFIRCVDSRLNANTCNQIVLYIVDNPDYYKSFQKFDRNNTGSYTYDLGGMNSVCGGVEQNKEVIFNCNKR